MAGFKNVIARIKAVITADNSQFKQEVKETEQETKKAGKGIANTGKLIKAALGTAAVAGAIKLVKNIAQVRMEFEKYEAMLKVALGSQEAATKSMSMLTQFAAETPFQLNQLTGAYVKLVNQGFKPTKEQMRSLGDVAAAMGKDFDQLTEAIIDAQTGEFERLKEFGIRASKAGDQVTFTFKGVETQVDFTADSIREYVLAIGNAEGISGSMAEISATLGGRVSNLGDAWDSLMNQMGSKSSGIMVNVINWAIDLVNGLKMAAMSIEEIKAAVSAEVDAANLNEALTYITGLTDSYKKFYDSQEEAQKAAIKAYMDNTNAAIESTRLKLATMEDLTDGQKENLNKQIRQLEAEQAAVKAHYQELDLMQQKALDAYQAKQEEQAAKEKKIQDKKLADEKKYWVQKIGVQGLAKAETEGLTYAEVALGQAMQTAGQAAAQQALANVGLLEGLPAVQVGVINTTTAVDELRHAIKTAWEGTIDWDATMDSMMMAALQTSDQIRYAYDNVTLAAGYTQEEVDQAGKDMQNSWRESARAAANAARSEIRVYIAKAVAATVSKALGMLPPPFNIALAAAAGVAAGALFDRIIPSFAEGGMVTGPTLALVGDNPSGKEAIIPWEKMGSMGGDTVIPKLVIKGSDLHVIFNRYSNQLNRAGRIT